LVGRWQQCRRAIQDRWWETDPGPHPSIANPAARPGSKPAQMAVPL